MIRSRLVSDLKHFEGLSLELYKDTRDKWTIGYGRNLSDNGITPGEAEFLFDRDIENALVDARKVPAFYRCSCDQQEVLVHLVFNMGLPSVLTFKKMLAALEGGDGETAAKELLDSKYAREDVPSERSALLARRLRHAE